MKMSILLCSILLGCGAPIIRVKKIHDPTIYIHARVDSPITSVDPILIANVQQFYKYANTNNFATNKQLALVQLVSQLTSPSLDNDVSFATCYTEFNSDGSVFDKQVDILQNYWSSASLLTQRTLVYHELGECALDLSATNNPDQIMSSPLIDDSYAEQYWDSLETSEFNSSPLGTN